MAKKRDEKTVNDYLYDYQTRLQGVANDLGVRLGALMISSDAKVLKLLRSELPKYKDGKKEFERLEKIVSKIEAVRSPAYSAAQDMVLNTSASVVQAATSETAKEFNKLIAEQRRKIREDRFCKELTKKQQESIIEGQGIDGASISDWFWRWKRGDLERLNSLAKRASVETMTVAQITKAAKGAIENNYDDGVFTETRTSAARMARTIVNGVSNNARVETIVQNSDAIDGVKFVGTLDGKTCPYCASYDGYIWRGEEMAEARRPPIHPNCRCCLIPYVELKDDEGNVVDVDGDRPAANADFDKLAQDAYNERAREKGWKRRWDDLSPSTRLKYYYQAQKDYEERTGKPAFRQVSGATTFQEYFHRQPDSFKRAWLGAKRYELYKDGKLKEKSIFKPDLTYKVSIESLVRDGFRIAQEVGKQTSKKIVKGGKKTTEKQNSTQDKKKSDPEYKPVRISIWIADGMVEITESTLDSVSIKELLNDYEIPEKKFIADFKRFKANTEKTIEERKPNQEDYSEQTSYEQELQKYQEDKARLNNFVAKIEKELKLNTKAAKETKSEEEEEEKREERKETRENPEKEKKNTEVVFVPISPSFRGGEISVSEWREELEEIKRSDRFLLKVKELEEAEKNDLKLLQEMEPKNGEV